MVLLAVFLLAFIIMSSLSVKAEEKLEKLKRQKKLCSLKRYQQLIFNLTVVGLQDSRWKVYRVWRILFMAFVNFLKWQSARMSRFIGNGTWRGWMVEVTTPVTISQGTEEWCGRIQSRNQTLLKDLD